MIKGQTTWNHPNPSRNHPNPPRNHPNSPIYIKYGNTPIQLARHRKESKTVWKVMSLNSIPFPWWYYFSHRLATILKYMYMQKKLRRLYPICFQSLCFIWIFIIKFMYYGTDYRLCIVIYHIFNKIHVCYRFLGVGSWG